MPDHQKQRFGYFPTALSVRVYSFFTKLMLIIINSGNPILIYCFIFRKLHYFFCNFQVVCHTYFQRIVFPFMTYRKIKANGVVIFLHDIVDVAECHRFRRRRRKQTPIRSISFQGNITRADTVRPAKGTPYVPELAVDEPCNEQYSVSNLIPKLSRNWLNDIMSPRSDQDECLSKSYLPSFAWTASVTRFQPAIWPGVKMPGTPTYPEAYTYC